MHHAFLSRRNWLLLLAALAVATLCSFSLPLRGEAQSAADEPWHPVAAAYLRAIFYANLVPQINWDLISAEYENPISEEGYQNRSVLDLMGEADAATGSAFAPAIRQAIADKDRQALYRSSTRALSNMIRDDFATAESKLAEPGAALADVQEAMRYYRAFHDHFMEQADPVGVLTLDEAWQEMESSVGSSSAAADAQRFAKARAAIQTYLAANYEVETFSQRRQLAPIPERVGDAEVTAWLPPGSHIDEQDPLPLLRLNFESKGFDERDIPLVAYGDMLFDSPQIFGEPARTLGVACSSCHNRSDINKDFFIPGVSPHSGAADVDGGFFNPFFNDQRDDPLDIPSMRGIRFTAPYGRDGRFGSLREFTRNVIVNEFGGAEPTPFMLDALVAYMFEFDWQPNSMLKRDGTLNATAPEAAQRGEFLFNKPFAAMGGQSCSGCHLPGSNFIDGERHDIGSDPSSEPFALDAFFDTPTLLNTMYSAPYFHDGSLETLADVVAWFDSTYELNLTASEQADLTAYLEAVGASDTPYTDFDDENTEFMLAWNELNTFCSTLGSKLIPQQDAYHALLLLDTVTPDLRADASELQDPSLAPLVYEVADKLDEVKAAIQDGDWEKAMAMYNEYYALFEKNGPQLK